MSLTEYKIRRAVGALVILWLIGFPIAAYIDWRLIIWWLFMPLWVACVGGIGAIIFTGVAGAFIWAFGGNGAEIKAREAWKQQKKMAARERALQERIAVLEREVLDKS
jgi:hypothetical protein